MKKVIAKAFIIIILILIVFSLGKRTYSALYSLINGKVDIETADFNILLNDVDIKSVYEVDINDIVWINDNALLSTLAPSSKGVYNLELDASGTDVALIYTISFIDKTVDSTKLLTVTGLFIDEVQVQVVNNEYIGYISLIDIEKIVDIEVEVEWINDELNNDADSNIGINNEEVELLDVTFNVKQNNE